MPFQYQAVTTFSAITQDLDDEYVENILIFGQIDCKTHPYVHSGVRCSSSVEDDAVFVLLQNICQRIVHSFIIFNIFFNLFPTHTVYFIQYGNKQKGNHLIAAIKLASVRDWYLILIPTAEHTPHLQKICHHPLIFGNKVMKHTETQTGRWKIQAVDFSLAVFLPAEHLLIVDIWKVGELSIYLTACLSCLAGRLWQKTALPFLGQNLNPKTYCFPTSRITTSNCPQSWGSATL